MNIKFTRSTRKDFDRLPALVQDKVRAAIEVESAYELEFEANTTYTCVCVCPRGDDATLVLAKPDHDENGLLSDGYWILSTSPFGHEFSAWKIHFASHANRRSGGGVEYGRLCMVSWSPSPLGGYRATLHTLGQRHTFAIKLHSVADAQAFAKDLCSITAPPAWYVEKGI